MVRATPVAVVVAAPDMTAGVALGTELMMLPPGMPEPLIGKPTSFESKAAVAEVTVVEPLVVTPSVTVRGEGRPASKTPISSVRGSLGVGSLGLTGSTTGVPQVGG